MRHPHTTPPCPHHLARWPVTVAQFRVFIEDARFTPADPDCLNGIANHPVVNVVV